jgi:hypothetical protein
MLSLIRREGVKTRSSGLLSGGSQDGATIDTADLVLHLSQSGLRAGVLRNPE